MIAYDEDVAKGIYNKKCWGDSFSLCVWFLFIILLVSIILVIGGGIGFAFLGVLWAGRDFSDVFIKMCLDIISVFSQPIFCIFLFVLFCFVVICGIKYYFCKIHCLMVLDKKKLHIIGYLRGQKIEKIVNIKDIKQIESDWDFFSYTVAYKKDKKYVEVTLVMNEGKRIKNIPVEYESELYHFLKELNK